MAIFRKVHTSIWSDSFFSELDLDKKLFYLYLLTNERTKQCGVYEITKKQIGFDIGYSIDRVSILLKYFISTGKIRYNEDTFEMALGNWLKYNSSTSPKVQSCINKEFGEVKDTLLIQYVKSMDTASQQEEEQEQTEEEEQEPKKKKPIAASGPPGVYKKITDLWFEHSKSITGLKPKFNAVDGKQLKTIIKYISENQSEGQKTEDTFKYILDNWGKLEGWLQQNCLDLKIFNQKINIIISQLKNGTSNKKGSNSVSANYVEHLRQNDPNFKNY